MIVKNYALKYLQSGTRKKLCSYSMRHWPLTQLLDRGRINLNYLCLPQHVEFCHKIFVSVMVLFAEIQGTQTIASHFSVSFVPPV